ncbi:MAG: hypothetical protein JNM95_08450 [Chitinophagaceae bacterium]|nr:hypothetical protein [Chitinophagaceae bacterium]
MSLDTLSFKSKSFKEAAAFILDECYPILFEHLRSMDKCLKHMSKEYDVVMLEGSVQNVYQSFDKMFRLEKLVLFPKLILLEDEHKVPESDAPFHKLKQDFYAILKQLELAVEQVQNTYVNEDNEFCIHHLLKELDYFRDLLSDVEELKESFYEINFHEVR